MTAITWDDIAASILADVRATYPTASKPDAGIRESWARKLARSRRVYPAALWREAVDVWAVSHSEPPTPHDIITAAGQVAAQWEMDPKYQPLMEACRYEHLRGREVRGELPLGTVPESLSTGRQLAVGGRHRPERVDWQRRMKAFRAELEQRRGVA